MDPQREVAFFDKFAQEHGEYDVLAEAAYARLSGLLRRHVSPRRGEKCIDLGCGTGAFTKRLRGLGLDLMGMDISPASVERANAVATEETYVVGDIMHTGASDATYDIILYSGVLHHIDTHESRIDVLREGHRILRPGGRLFAYDPSAHSPSMWLYRDPRSPLYSSKGKTENEVLLTKSGLEGEMRAAGFGEVTIRGVSGILFRYVESRLAPVILPLYNLYERAIRYSPFEDHLGTFLVSVAKK
jgi:SAM-dependent methyltransferase